MSNEGKILELLQQMNTRFDKVDARLEQMDARLDKMDARLDKMDARFETDIDDLKEGQEEIRDAVNCLLEWADKVSRASKFPLPEVLGA